MIHIYILKVKKQPYPYDLFTNGYDVFHIPKIPLFHCYVDYSNSAKRPMHWNIEEDKDRSVKWTELASKEQRKNRKNY